MDVKFEIIFNKEIINLIVDKLLDKNYVYIENIYTEGDNDILVIDTQEEEFTYFENGCGISHSRIKKGVFESLDEMFSVFN